MAMSVVSRSVLNDQTRALQTPADQGLFPCNRATPVPASVLLAPWETPTRVASGGLPDLDSTLTKIFSGANAWWTTIALYKQLVFRFPFPVMIKLIN